MPPPPTTVQVIDAPGTGEPPASVIVTRSVSASRRPVVTVTDWPIRFSVVRYRAARAWTLLMRSPVGTASG